MRREIELALRDLPDAVIPVLIDTSMPKADTLPRSLRGLCRREPVQLRHVSFEHDLTALVARLEATSDRPVARARAGRAAGDAPGRPDDRTRTTAGVSSPYHDHYADVVRGMLDGGGGAAARSRRRGRDGDSRIASSDQFATTSAGLAEVAQRVAVTLGERRLYTAIKSLVAAQSQPGRVHRFLAEFPGIVRRLGLPPRHQLIISGNYDLGARACVRGRK